MDSFVNYDNINNTQIMDTTQMLIDKLMHRGSILYSCNGMLFDLGKYASFVICDNMDRNGVSLFFVK